MRPVRWLSALVMVLILAVPASAGHGGIHPTFSTRNVYFHCSGETKLYQANWLIALATTTNLYGGATAWNTTQPSQSVTEGAGCGAFDVGWSTNEIYDAVFEGTFTGNLRDLTVRIHEFASNQTRSGASKQLKIFAAIDGEPIFPIGGQEGTYEGRNVSVTPTRVNSGATDLYEFSITNIGYAQDIFDSQGKPIDVETGGMALEDGNGSTEHTLRLFIGGESAPLEGDPPTGLQMWAWDTTEVPSGITFNPASLAAAKVAADLPNFG
jgi:hypothetical protein